MARQPCSVCGVQNVPYGHYCADLSRLPNKTLCSQQADGAPRNNMFTWPENHNKTHVEVLGNTATHKFRHSSLELDY